jgi:hypothetical protein
MEVMMLGGEGAAGGSGLLVVWSGGVEVGAVATIALDITRQKRVMPNFRWYGFGNVLGRADRQKTPGPCWQSDARVAQDTSPTHDRAFSLLSTYNIYSIDDTY